MIYYSHCKHKEKIKRNKVKEFFWFWWMTKQLQEFIFYLTLRSFFFYCALFFLQRLGVVGCPARLAEEISTFFNLVIFCLCGLFHYDCFFKKKVKRKRKRKRLAGIIKGKASEARNYALVYRETVMPNQPIIGKYKKLYI